MNTIIFTYVFRAHIEYAKNEPNVTDSVICFFP